MIPKAQAMSGVVVVREAETETTAGTNVPPGAMEDSRAHAYAYTRARTYAYKIQLAFAALMLLAGLGIAFAQRVEGQTRKVDAARELKDRKTERRLEALRAAREGRGQLTGAQLSDAMKAEKFPAVRARVLQTAEAVKAENRLGLLLDALKTDAAAPVRRRAARQLANYVQSEGVVAALVKALESDPALDVRQGAAWALGFSQDEAALAALERAADGAEDGLKGELRRGLERRGGERAAKALGKLAEGEAP